MKNEIRKKLFATSAILLMALASAALAYLPFADAAVVNKTLYIYNTVAPNPVGAGQPTLIVIWSDLVPGPDTPTELAAGVRGAWHNIIVTLTKPDGTTQTFGPLSTDPIGSTYVTYTPVAIGTYSIQASFPGEWRNYTNTNTQYYFAPTTTAKGTFTVQQEKITEYPGVSLPTGFWQRPIENENREWGARASNWLGVSFLYSKGAYNASGSVNPYSKAPNSAHIIWTKPIAFGGIVGGETGDAGYYSGLTYESKWSPPIIMNGRLYYNTPSYPKYGFTCVDLRTGATLWWQNSTGAPSPSQNSYSGGLAYPQLTCGQLYEYESSNQHGVIPYLWSLSSTAGYQMYDAFTGNWICTMANASTGQVVMGEKGDLLVYILNGARNWFALWNSSKVKGMLLGTSGTNALQWRPPVGVTLDWSTGIQWNVTVPDVPGTQTLTKVGDVVLSASSADATTVCITGYSMQNGNQLYSFNMTSNTAAPEQGLYTYYFGPPVGGVFCWFKQETREWYGFDSYTGQKLWGPSVAYENPWGMFSSTSSGNGAMSPNMADGKLYAEGYDGVLHSINAKTGTRVWDYYAGNSGLETPYGSYPFGSGMFAIADGKVFVATGEHSPNQPMWRGSRLHVIDETSGKGLWNVLGWYETPAIADGYLVAFNNYDSQIYSFGKGLSATTIAAGPEVATRGSTVLIKGAVTDQSPGQTCLGIPAAGTPAISDASMSQWMEYLYMQKPKPTNATGVTVHLTAIDPNGNFQDIGNVTSDAKGNYFAKWVPPVPGMYKLTASFDGSESYFASDAETGFIVTESASVAPATTPTATIPIPTQTPMQTASASPSPAVQPPTSSMPITTYIAIGVAIIIIVAAAAALVLRKRK